MSKNDLLEQYLEQLKQLDSQERIQIIMQIAAMGGKDIAVQLVELLHDENAQLQQVAVQLMEDIASKAGAKAINLWKQAYQKDDFAADTMRIQLTDNQLKTVEILQLLDSGDNNLTETLFARFQEESDTEVRQAILYAVRVVGDYQIIPMLYRIVNDRVDAKTKDRALEMLHTFSTTDQIPQLETALNQAKESETQQAYAYALGATQSIEAITPLLNTLQTDMSLNIQKVVINALTKLGSAAIPRLILVISDGSSLAKAVAAWVLGQIDRDGRSVHHLIPLLNDETEITFFTGEFRVCDVVAQVLKSINKPNAQHAVWLFEQDDRR